MSEKSQFKANNHYVPRMLMSPWAVDGQIWRYRLLVSHENVRDWKRVSLESVASHQFLYSTTSASVGARKSDDLESWFDREIEQPSTVPLEKARSGEALSELEWQILAKFILAQDLRVIATFLSGASEMTSMHDMIIKKILDDIGEELKEKPVQDSVKFLGKEPHKMGPVQLPFAVRIDPDPTSQQALISTRFVAGKHMWLYVCHRGIHINWPVVAGQDWAIVTAPSGVEWPMTDRPVAKVRFNSINDFDFNGAWGLDRTKVLFPISPKKLMVCFINKRNVFKDGDELPIQQALLYRFLIIRNAYRVILASKADSSIPGIYQRKVDPLLYKKEQSMLSQLESNEDEALRQLAIWRGSDEAP